MGKLAAVTIERFGITDQAYPLATGEYVFQSQSGANGVGLVFSTVSTKLGCINADQPQFLAVFEQQGIAINDVADFCDVII